jgi:hypothetical protein
MVRVGYICLGSINEVYVCCGSRYCDCKKKKENRHGPYYLWTRKVNNKTRSKYLSKKQAALCRRYMKNYEKMTALIEKMKNLSEKMIENSK